MSYGVRLHVWGERALFTRPEFKSERMTYDVITPSAARGVLESIHWKPQIVWRIDRIHVLKPVRFASFRRNEVGGKTSAQNVARAMKTGSLAGLGISVDGDRQQRASTFLIDVAYVIEAHFEMTAKANGDDPAKHISTFNRRAAAGQCFHRPCLGTRECAANFALIRADAPMPESKLPEDQRNRDLGWMLHDIDFIPDRTSRFYRARLENGVIDVNECVARGIAA